MPRLLPRASAVVRSASVVSSSSNPAIALLTRPFSTSSPCHEAKIPPESPSWINVPTPPLSQVVEDIRAPNFKGHLPLPRKVFEQRGGHRKPEAGFLAQSAPKPTSEASKLPPQNEYIAWKRAMADSRRKNMELGIRGLWQRKQRTDALRVTRQSQRRERNRTLALAPEREDERLTRSSINPGTLATTVELDPLRFERALESKKRTEALLEQKSQDKKEALSMLYMHARSFIVTEKALEAKVDELFTPDYWSRKRSATGTQSANIWDSEGAPMSVGYMLSGVTRADSHLLNSAASEGDRSSARQKQIAEVLTGGPIN